MPQKRWSVEHTINHLREVSVLLGQGRTVGADIPHHSKISYPQTLPKPLFLYPKNL